MSLLKQQTSLSDIIHEEDDEPQSAVWDNLYNDQDDVFADDIDDDDLSFDGIYDEEDLPLNPPRYREPSPPVDLSELPRLLNTLSIVGKRPSTSNRSPRPQAYYPGIDVCIVCQERPPYSKNGKSFPTCGLTCAAVLERALDNNNSSSPPPQGRAPPHTPRRKQSKFSFGQSQPSTSRTQRSFRPPMPHASSSSTVYNVPITNPCVVCRQRECQEGYVTCGLRCGETLFTSGSSDPTMCNYCHRRQKLSGHDQCGKACADLAKTACLLCKSRPKFKHYHLCGKSCKQLSTQRSPLLLEAPEGHATWDLVQKKFDSAWKYGTKPAIKKIYKIIESKNFLLPYDKYKKRVGRRTEVFRYHGTSRKCTLGTNGNTTLCNDSKCALCCILKTSFKTSIANPNGAFGAGIYSSSAANKAYSYSAQGNGAMILTKVVLGKVYDVSNFAAVNSCPAGYNSVVFDRQAGSLNETIVYSDDAIRPVFLIMFK